MVKKRVTRLVSMIIVLISLLMLSTLIIGIFQNLNISRESYRYFNATSASLSIIASFSIYQILNKEQRKIKQKVDQNKEEYKNLFMDLTGESPLFDKSDFEIIFKNKKYDSKRNEKKVDKILEKFKEINNLKFSYAKYINWKKSWDGGHFLYGPLIIIFLVSIIGIILSDVLTSTTIAVSVFYILFNMVLFVSLFLRRFKLKEKTDVNIRK